MTAVLVTDADCGFCQASAHWLSRNFGIGWRNHAVSGLTADAVELIEFSDQFERVERRRLRGAAAVARVIELNGGIWRLVALGRVPPLIWLLQILYKWIARNRHRLPGGTAACELN